MPPTAVVADLLIVVCCLAACAYCYVLSRRLAVFRDEKEGMGQAVESMNQSLEAVRQAIAEVRADLDNADDRLMGRARVVEEQANELSRLIEAGDLRLRKLDAALRALGSGGLDDLLPEDDPNFDIVPRGFLRRSGGGGGDADAAAGEETAPFDGAAR